MSEKPTRKRKLGTPANIVASAFNLPVMVLAGLFIGSILSSSYSSPIRELVIIGSAVVFFVIAMIELYLVVRYQDKKYESSLMNKDDTLAKLILDDQEMGQE